MSPRTLIIGGGGVKGAAILGALYELSTSHPDTLDIGSVTTFVGVSVGSIIAFLLVLGLDPVHIWAIFTSLDPAKVRHVRVLNFFLKFGLDTGERLMASLRTTIRQHHVDPDVTFLELFQATHKELHILATNLSRHCGETYTHTTHPHMKVCDAIRRSISIPFFFTPVYCPLTLCYYIDGCVACELPLDAFEAEPRYHPVLGVVLHNESNYTGDTYHPITGLRQFLWNVLEIFWKRDQYEFRNLAKRTNVLSITTDPTTEGHRVTGDTQVMRSLFKTGRLAAQSWCSLA